MLLIGGGSGLAGVVTAIVKTRGATSVQSADLKARIDSQIDLRVKQQLDDQDEEIRNLKTQVADLQDSNRVTKRENVQIKLAVKSWFRDLVLWNRAGRPGTIPLPSQEDLDLLDLDPNGPTLSRAELDELRKG